MNLRITTTPALIGIHTTKGSLEIQQPKADMELMIVHPKVEIHSQQIRVQIDQRQCFAEAGLKNILDMAIDTTAYAKQRVAEGIDRIVRQGNELASIHLNTNPIADQAEENSMVFGNHEFNFDIIPKSRPKIDFVGGNVDIQIIEGKVNSEVQVNRPMINYIRGNTEIYLRQKNSIHMEYMGNHLDVKG
ncbi:DUF6470 family protein [Thermotalea metallivorans]|uniref:Uncharacterized protein n=1 Tax=Thermotalea metallivorans TaxID=520762 RepID=A0A140L711_9FIRM|nr:DUF6470 family protein [Thermotalea metallivorans]KXG76336.1 hypothetical protein AN619_12940 [Thermotalea metallivorans]